MPVGRISYLYLEPLSFEEFLIAIQKEKLQEYLQSWQWQQNIPEIIHEQLLFYLREYLFIGGMPEAVMHWREKSSLSTVSETHQNLLATYRDDFAKYTGKISTHLLEDVFSAIPHS